MTPTGKIARLPHDIREQLNHRLQDGLKAKPVLAWLNALPEVQATLKTEFDGHPKLWIDITRLGRGDLHAEQLTIGRGWLALDQSNTADRREKDFWKWTERPDIREKLFPDREGGLSPETLAKIEKELKLM